MKVDTYPFSQKKKSVPRRLSRSLFAPPMLVGAADMWQAVPSNSTCRECDAESIEVKGV